MAAEFDCSVRVENGRTRITVTGTQEAAVVVRSESGERIYLPPEGFDRDRDSAYQSADDSSYQSARDDSPYQSARGEGGSQSPREDSPYQSARDDSPYQSARDDSPYQSISRGPNVQQTRDGFRVTHPEPVTEYSVYR